MNHDGLKYKYIYDTKTNKKYSILEKEGKKVLREIIRYLKLNTSGQFGEKDKTQTYLTIDNGDLPFRVDVSSKIISIWKRDEEREEEWLKMRGSGISRFEMAKAPYYIKFYDIHDYTKIWIGKSPKYYDTSKSSGGFGSKWDGNSILIETKPNTYIWVGNEVKQFKTDCPIVNFVSLVGNSQVSYPWAVDETNNYYLMIDNIKISFKKDLITGEDPYNCYYHDNSKIAESLEYYVCCIHEKLC